VINPTIASKEEEMKKKKELNLFNKSSKIATK